MGVTIGIVKESTENETRVALVPEVTTKLGAMQALLLVESGAGVAQTNALQATYVGCHRGIKSYNSSACLSSFNRKPTPWMFSIFNRLSFRRYLRKREMNTSRLRPKK